MPLTGDIGSLSLGHNIFSYKIKSLNCNICKHCPASVNAGQVCSDPGLSVLCFRIVFEDVARLAFQRFADAGEGREPDGVDFVVFDLREIYVCDPDLFRQVVQ